METGKGTGPDDKEGETLESSFKEWKHMRVQAGDKIEALLNLPLRNGNSQRLPPVPVGARPLESSFKEWKPTALCVGQRVPESLESSFKEWKHMDGNDGGASPALLNLPLRNGNGRVSGGHDWKFKIS